MTADAGSAGWAGSLRWGNAQARAAYALHPVEAVVSGLVTPLAMAAYALHVGALVVFGVHQVVRNAQGHAASEKMPGGFVTHAFWGRYTTTTQHHLHHETAHGNHGLWFTWWDRLCNTERVDHRERFNAVTRARRSETECSRPDV